MKYFCRKHNKIVDIEKNCIKCFKESKSGFTDIALCQNYNLIIYEEKLNVIK